MQGVYIYCAEQVQKIAEILGDEKKAEELEWKPELKQKQQEVIFLSGNRTFCKWKRKTDKLCKPGVDDTFRSSQSRRRRAHPGSGDCGGSGKRNGVPIYESSFCRSASCVRQKRAGHGLHEILLGWNDRAWSRYVLGAVQSKKSVGISIWLQHCEQLLSRMELYTGVFT